MLTWCYRDLDVSVIYCKFSRSCPCDVPFLAVSLFSCEKSTVTIVTFPTSRKNGGFGNPPACWGLFFWHACNLSSPRKVGVNKTEERDAFKDFKGFKFTIPIWISQNQNSDHHNRHTGLYHCLFNFLTQRRQAPIFCWKSFEQQVLVLQETQSFESSPANHATEKKSERLDLCSFRGFGNTVWDSLYWKICFFFCCFGLGNPLAVGHIGFIV